jgi:hypothetical protein
MSKYVAIMALLVLGGCANVTSVGNTHLVQEATNVCCPYFGPLGENSRSRHHSAAFVVILAADATSPAPNLTVAGEQKFVTLRVLSDAGGAVPTFGIVHDPPLMDHLGHPNNLKPVQPTTVGLLEFERRGEEIWSVG